MLILTLKAIVPMKNLTTDEYSLISSFLCNTDKINFFLFLWRTRLIKASTMIDAFTLFDKII